MSTQKNVAIYCRVDAGGAPDARTRAIEGQKELLINYAKSHGLKVVGCFEDNGYAGNVVEGRPGLMQLMKSHEMFHSVLVVNRDRLFRGDLPSEPKWPFTVLSINDLMIQNK